MLDMNSQKLILQPHTPTAAAEQKNLSKMPREEKYTSLESKMVSGPFVSGKGKRSSCRSLEQSRWEIIEFLEWVSSSQQPKLVDFDVLSRLGSAPPRSWDGQKRKTSQAKKHSKGARKPKSRQEDSWYSLQVRGREGKKNSCF